MFEGFDFGVALILISTIVQNSAYALIAPLLPFEFREKGLKGDPVGLIFASYPIAVIAVSPLTGVMIERVGTTATLTFGLILMGICFFLYAFIDKMDDNWLIFLYALMLRFLQGGASALVQTTNYSIATNRYPDI